MRSASDRLPRERILFTSWVTSTERKTGSGTRSRRAGGPLRGTSALLLGAVAAARLGAVTDARGVERPADDLVAHARQVLHTAAAHEHDRVLLQVVADAGDVGGHLDPAREPDTRHLAQGGVRLLRGRRVDPRAHAAPLGRAAQRRRLRLRPFRLPSLADELGDGGHAKTSPRALFLASRRAG